MKSSPSGKKILIVDDEKSLVEFIESVLVSRGHKVVTASNGVDGLKKISDGDPDLLILDMTMPRMGGVELYSKICSRYGRTRFPVIVLTALDAMSDFFEGALVDRFMAKPFKVKELLDEIDALLDEKSRQLVWLIESDEAEARRISLALEGERFAVRRSSSLVQALSGIGVQPQYIFVEVSDEKAVDEAVRTLHAIDATKRTPIIFYSRDEKPGIRPRVLSAGGDAYLGKLDDLKPVFTAMRQLQKKSPAPGRNA